MELITLMEKETTTCLANLPYFQIESTQSTPKIILDSEKGTLIFEGHSLPENPITFYNPVKNWIKEYLEDPSKETFVKFNLDYFNTASSKVIMNIIEMFKVLDNDQHKITIEWHYQMDDEDTLEAGEEFAQIAGMDFIFISYL